MFGRSDPAPPDDADDPVAGSPASRWLLAAVGGIAFGAGVLLTFDGALGLSGAGSTVLALLGAAVVAVTGFAGLRRSLEPGEEPAAASPAAPAPAGPLAPCPTCEARDRHADLWDAFDGFPLAATDPVALAGRASVAHASTTAELLWSSWSPSAGELPVALIGPVPETAYVAPRDDEPDPFADQAPEFFVDLRTGDLLAPEALGAGAELVEELPVGGTPPSIPSLPAGLPGTPTAAEGAVRRVPVELPLDALPVMVPGEEEIFPVAIAGGFAAAPSDLVRLEALSALPPHLRRAPAPLPAAPPARPAPAARRGAASAGGRCASCRQALEDPVAWRRCRSCSRPLCHACLVTSLVQDQRAWCTACAAERGEALLDVGS